jgi:hypothetical protein
VNGMGWDRRRDEKGVVEARRRRRVEDEVGSGQGLQTSSEKGH